MTVALNLDEAIPQRITIAASGCWLWTGTINRRGYGAISVRGETKMAHRVVYEREVGPIPAGMQIDHLCRNKACVNPAHLEPVTGSENCLRAAPFHPGSVRKPVRKPKTHCKRGHEYAGANIYLYRNGRRQCLTCEKMRQAKRPSRSKATRQGRAA